MSGMDERFRKQSQTTYIPRFHRIAAEKGPFFEKNEWHRSMIQGLAQNKAKQNQTTYTLSSHGITAEKGRFSIKMNGTRSMI
jgi:hypothetical protein